VKRVRENLEYDIRSVPWIDFQEKMNYLLLNLFGKDKGKLIEHFSDKTKLTPQYLKSRKRVIDNWLNGESLKANNFDVKKFKIGDLKLNDKALFSNKSFRLGSIANFKKRLDNYLDNQEVYGHIQYIYFFDTQNIEQKISRFDVSFPKDNSVDSIQLRYANILYSGRIERFNMVTYIYLKSDYDHMNCIFKISANTSKDLRVFGIANTMDDATGKAKAFQMLLTSYPLTKDEEEKYAHKLNLSNIMLAEDFSKKCILKENYFMENFTQKIATLGKDLHHYEIDKSFSEDIYLDTILKEFENYMKFLEKAYKHTKYFIGNKKESQLFSMKGICNDKKIEVSISYFLSVENLFLLENRNPIIENQIKLIKEDKLALTYQFIVVDAELLTNRVLEKIEYMQKSGIKIMMSNSLNIGYSKLLLIKDTNFALFKFKDLIDDPTHVTRHHKTIAKLTLAQELLAKESLPFEEYMQRENPISGRWYLYNYGSAMDKSNCHVSILNIKNNRVKGDFPSRHKEGVVFKTRKQILLIFDTITIKISKSSSIGQSISRVSIISQDIDIRTADLLVFGIFSKKALEKEEIISLLDTIHMREEADYRLKVSDSFPRKLAEFKRSRGMNHE